MIRKVNVATMIAGKINLALIYGKRNFPLVEQADKERSGYLEQIRRLLGGQFSMDRNQGDGIPPGHFSQ